MLKKAFKNKIISGTIEIKDDNKIVVKLDNKNSMMKEGNHVIASVVVEKRLDTGDRINDASIIARGLISEAKGEKITIESNKISPLISPGAFDGIVPKVSRVGIKLIDE